MHPRVSDASPQRQSLPQELLSDASLSVKQRSGHYVLLVARLDLLSIRATHTANFPLSACADTCAIGEHTWTFLNTRYGKLDRPSGNENDKPQFAVGKRLDNVTSFATYPTMYDNILFSSSLGHGYLFEFIAPDCPTRAAMGHSRRSSWSPKRAVVSLRIQTLSMNC